MQSDDKSSHCLWQGELKTGLILHDHIRHISLHKIKTGIKLYGHMRRIHLYMIIQDSNHDLKTWRESIPYTICGQKKMKEWIDRQTGGKQ